MANTTIYPYGTNGQLPSSIGVINDLTTGGADKALSAEMGKELNNNLLPITGGTQVLADLNTLTSGYYKYGNIIASESHWFHTDLIKISDIDSIDFKSYSDDAVSTLCYFDVQRNYLSATGHRNDYIEITSPSELNQNATYVAFSVTDEHDLRLSVTKNVVGLVNEIIENLPPFGTYEMALYISKKYFNPAGVETTTANHNIFKYDGEGKSVRITTKSDDEDAHPLAALYDENDNVVKYLIFPVPERGVIKEYSADVNVDVGQYVLVSAFKTNIPKYTYIDDIETSENIEDIDGRLCGDDARIRYGVEDTEFKAVMLDCGRKYFSVANIKLLIDALYINGLNTLELHYSEDEGFRFSLSDMDINVDGTTYDLANALGDGIKKQGNPDGSDMYLTESDMDEIIAYAETKNVQIIPAMDMPAHLGAILKEFPQFKYDSTIINFFADVPRKFILTVLDKYASYFASKGCRYFNICADEIGKKINKDVWDRSVVEFINDAAKVIIRNGLIPIAFNDYFGRGFDTNSGFIVYYWGKMTGYATAADVEKEGYRMVNVNYNYYYVLGDNYKPSAETLSAFKINTFVSSQHVDKPVGGMFCIWCDKADTDGADEGNALIADVIPRIAGFGTAMAKGFYSGQMVFDSTSGKPKWWNGTAWVDATGMAFSNS